MICAALLICVFATTAFAGNPIKLLINGQEVECDLPPQILDGRVMVPMRWVVEALGAEVQWDGRNNEILISNPDFISSNLEAGAKLYPFKEIDGMYDGFILEVKDNRKYFNWENVSNPTYAPRILFDDINRDGQKELIIILVTGTGTGVHIEDIHVINPDTFAAIEVEAPGDIVEKYIDSKIESNGDKVAIHIVIGDEKTTIYQEKDYAAVWFDNAIFSSSFRYEVIDNKLMLRLPAQVSPAGFIGEIEVTYEYLDGKYAVNTIQYNNEEDVPVDPATDPATGQPNSASGYMQALRQEYYEFGIENRLDYVPVFEEGKAPSSSTEYLFYAFAVNLKNWGDDKGTMTRDYVEQVIHTHFEVEDITHASLHKGWDYDGEKYTAIPQGIKEEPIHVLQEYDTYAQNGRTIYEITLDQCSFGGVLPSDEDLAGIKEGIVSGDLSALTVQQTECFQYYLDQATGEVVFLSHTLVQ